MAHARIVARSGHRTSVGTHRRARSERARSELDSICGHFRRRVTPVARLPGRTQSALVCSMKETTEIRNGLSVTWNVPIVVRDGSALRADVFRPEEPGRYPALVSYGPYAKGLAFQ